MVFQHQIIQLIMAGERVINCTKVRLNISDHNDWSKQFAINSPPCIWGSSFRFIGEVAPKKKTAKLRHLGFPIQSTVGDALMKITLGKAFSSWAGHALTPPT